MSLLKETGPLAITSANPSGACDCTHHNKVDDVIAKKIDFILADGASPYTIASSVIDVRELENDKICFYRVGCVPEAEIWKNLRSVEDLQEDFLCADIPQANLATVKALMNLILEALNCDTWSIYCLQNRASNISSSNIADDLSTPFTGEEEKENLSWTAVRDRYPRVQDVFETGVSYYTSSEEMVVRDEKSEMLIPINHILGVCAVLRLSNRRDTTDGSLRPFNEHDLTVANLTCTILLNHIQVNKARHDESNGLEPPPYTLMTVRKFDESSHYLVEELVGS